MSPTTTTPLNTFPLPPSFPSTETLYYPPATTPISDSPPPALTLLLFLPGNPGVIHYYTSFLSTLSSLLQLNASANNVHILGVSHAGFDTRPAGDKRRYGLREQIDGKVKLLEWIAGQWGEGKLLGGRKEDGGRLRVVVVGHSVGAFVALEVVKCIGERRREGWSGGEVNVIGGVMLFPTIVDIALSPKGRMLTPLFRSPLLCTAIAHFAKLLTLVLPGPLLSALVRLFTNSPPHAVEATVRMLACGNAVAEAFYMAREEMDEITADRWGADIWGAAEEIEDGIWSDGCDSGGTYMDEKDGEKAERLEMVFYFGKDGYEGIQDHWVANSTRDELIRLRGRTEEHKWKPKMIVCEDGLPHGFCISHGERVAEKVAVWIKGMVER
ncbi:hypothetical protein RUND412_010067 [Rhizina undulata]